MNGTEAAEYLGIIPKPRKGILVPQKRIIHLLSPHVLYSLQSAYPMHCWNLKVNFSKPTLSIGKLPFLKINDATSSLPLLDIMHLRFLKVPKVLQIEEHLYLATQRNVCHVAIVVRPYMQVSWMYLLDWDRNFQVFLRALIFFRNRLSISLAPRT